MKDYTLETGQGSAWEGTRESVQSDRQENAGKELFVKQLKEMLDWYTFHASDEEFDERNVERILGMLDSLEPIPEAKVPRREETWEQFRRIAVAHFGGKVPIAARFPALGRLMAPSRPLARVGSFAVRHRVAAAAVLAAVLLVVSGTAQAIATQKDGIFCWLKRDETGTQMMVSPSRLNDATDDKRGYAYFETEKAPEWVREWLEIAYEVEMPEGYEWQSFEISEFENFQSVVSYCVNEALDEQILLGVWIYEDKLSLNTERFDDYSFIKSYVINQKQMDIYTKTENPEETFYAICFYEGNCRYCVRGQDNMDELKMLAEQYWNCVRENL